MAENRHRTLTEKGKEYQLELLLTEFNNAYREWSKQLNTLRGSISDCDETDKIRNERSHLETRFEILFSTWRRLENLKSKEIEIPKSEAEKFNIAEQEHNDALKCANNRLLELKRAEETCENSSSFSRSVSSTSERTSQKSRSSAASSRSIAQRKIEAATKLAKLTAELKLADTERQKEAAFHHSQRELKKFKLEKGFEIAKAQMNAILNIEGTEFAEPPEENCSEERLENYLQTQIQSVTMTSQDKITSPYKHTNPFSPDSHVQSTPKTISFDVKNKHSLDIKTEHLMDSPIEYSTNIQLPLTPNRINTVSQSNIKQEHRKTVEPDVDLLMTKIEPESSRHSLNPFVSTLATQPKLESPLSPLPNPFFPQKSDDFIDSNENTFSDKPTNDDAIIKLVDLLSRRQEREHLPKREPEVFDGNLLDFPVWLKSFETLVEKRTTAASERIYYLGKYTSGAARESIIGFLSLDTDNAYLQAKRTLKKRFGDAFLVSDAYRKRINDWPRIAPNDGVSLRKFADFLESCRVAMQELDYLRVLNDPDENQKMLRKLPSYLAAQWGRTVDKWLETKDNKEQNVQNVPESTKTENAGYPPFSEFCKFLQREARIASNPVTSFQALRDAQKGKEEFKIETNRLTAPRKRNVANAFATAANEGRKKTYEEKTFSCPACKGPLHDLDSCQDFLKLPINERKDLARLQALCWGCLKHGHINRQCRRKLKCQKCDGRHPTSLHDDDFKPKEDTTKNKYQRSEASAVSHRVKVGEAEDNTDPISSHSLIVPVWLSHSNQPQRKLMVYALLDEQSDACFVKETTLHQLNVKGTEVSLKLTTMLGVENTTSVKITGLVVQGVNMDKEIHLPRVYSRDAIPANRQQIPRRETALKWPHLRNVADHLMPYRSDVEIAMLIGLNCACAIKPREVIVGNDNDPYAKHTALGWGIIGMVNTPKLSKKDHRAGQLSNGMCHLTVGTEAKEIITPQQVNRMFESDFNEKERDTKPLSQEDRQFLKIVEEGIQQRSDGHYEMPLPFKRNTEGLQNNRYMASNRLNQLRKRLKSDAKYRQDYNDFMTSIIKNGHAERVPQEASLNNGKVWYVPHHGVYHPQKPGKIRVVFDCSATHHGQSLNKQLLQGPDLTNNLVGVLCRFRQEPVAFMCDIEKMFFQVQVNEEYRDYLRFLWWEDGDIDSQPQEYRMTVHLFGAVSSPGCANYALKKTADDYKEELGSEAAKFVKDDFYVDDGLKSVPTTRDAIALINNTKSLCQKGGFRLHKFVCNNKEVTESVPQSERAEGKRNLDADKDSLSIERALGVQWCVESDTFQFRITLKDRPLTRRGILATVSSVFDPLGMLSPVILQGKRILQSLCRQGVEWDDRVPEELRPTWVKWRSELPALAELKVSRCYKSSKLESLKVAELHHFSDASSDGYGQCSYLKLVDVKDRVHCSLVMAKSRVTPLKSITIPRLELSAAVVSVRVSALLRKELEYDQLREVFWTDSKVVLGYISNMSRRFHVFVANRVQQILEGTSPKQWHYVDTKANPADDASRGLDAHEILNSSRWWKGPEFLWQPDQTDESNKEEFTINPEDPELKKATVFTTDVKEYTTITQRLTYFSDWYRAKKAVAACLRLQDRFKKPQDEQATKENSNTHNTVADLQRAEQEIIKKVQGESFKEEIKILSSLTTKNTATDRTAARERNTTMKRTSSLYRLDPFLDENGLLRVGGRLRLADIPYEAKHPVILPRKGHITNLVIRHFHERVHHQGRGLTQSEIKTSGFWIIGGSSAVTKHIADCVTCHKLRSDTQTQKMADLPKDRLEPSPPFTYVAVDYFGPWTIKEGRRQLKRYGALFTCMASRAVHIEVANSLDTDSFLNAYRRFIGRRGPARQLRSDQGTNFMGAKNELQKALTEMDNDKVRNELLKDNCDWVTFKTNVPHASHMGGVWERQIRSIRNVMNALLMKQGTQLDDESLRTLMVEAEAIVNSRPLTAESASSSDNMPLTPNHLLTQKSCVVLPPPGNFVRNDLYSRKRWRRVQHLADEFWHRWKKEFLQSLQHRQKWTRPKKNIMKGDIMLLKDDDVPRNRWRLCRVEDTYPSQDGLVRKVKIAVADKTDGQRRHTYLERPVHKLVLLLSPNDATGASPPRSLPS